MPIHHLIAGVHSFQQKAFRSQQELFDHLSRGQSPDTLFITCSDSRIDPNLLTQTDPGKLFTIRNAGNIVPATGRDTGGEVASLEYAVVALGVSDIVVCGHSGCGAMKALLEPGHLVELPLVAGWLEHAEATRRIMYESYKSLGREHLLPLTIRENVLVQLENIRTHAFVADRIEAGTLKLHGWVYDIGSGEVAMYDPLVGQFLPIARREERA